MKSDIINICEKLGIKNYTINDDLSINVDGYVNIRNKELTEIPIKFNKVSAYFDCSSNKLTSLKGSPRWVGKWFNCTSNDLIDLYDAPDYVEGNFMCDESVVGEKLERSIIKDYNKYIQLYRRKFKLNKILSKKKRKRGRPKKVKN